MGCFYSAPSAEATAAPASEANTTPAAAPVPAVAPTPVEPVTEFSSIFSSAASAIKSVFKRQLSIKNAESDVAIVKSGAYYVVQGTHAVVDMDTLEIIGSLDQTGTFYNKQTDYVKSVCAKFDLPFKATA